MKKMKTMKTQMVILKKMKILVEKNMLKIKIQNQKILKP